MGEMVARPDSDRIEVVTDVGRRQVDILIKPVKSLVPATGHRITQGDIQSFCRLEDAFQAGIEHPGLVTLAGRGIQFVHGQIAVVLIAAFQMAVQFSLVRRLDHQNRRHQSHCQGQGGDSLYQTHIGSSLSEKSRA